MSSSLLIAIVLASVLLPSYMYWYHTRIKSLLAAWAAANGFTVLESGRRFFPPQRMLLTTSRYQTLLRIKIYDPSTHRIRGGWLRLGTYWWGLLNEDAIDVHWDDA